MTSGITYTAPQPVNGYEAFDFEINGGSSPIQVRVSREAIEDYVAKQRVNAPTTPEDLLHFAEVYQPEFVQIALDKHRRLESVLITSEDVAD